MPLQPHRKSSAIAFGAAVVLLLSFSLACSTYNRPHAKRMISDAFRQPLTMPITAVPAPACIPYEPPWEMDWVDADGHGWFDVHAVAIEYLTVSPSLIVFFGLVYPTFLLESSLRSNDVSYVGECLWAANSVLITLPCIGLAVVEDVLIHDIPLTLFYAPALLIPSRRAPPSPPTHSPS